MDVKSVKEANAQVDIWQYVFGFTPMAVVKCAIELQIADVLESHGGAMSLIDLSSAVACSPSALHRIMSSVMLAPWHRLSTRSSLNGGSAFEATHGEYLWEYGAQNPAHSKLFNDAMATHAVQAVSEIVERYGEVFEGIGCLVDVGGGDGTAPRCIVEACPWIRGWVLHDWSDDECMQILRKCREAIPKETGKVIIAEAVINEGEEDKYSDVRLALDMVMMAHTDKGKERTIQEWDLVIKGAGVSSYMVKHIGSITAVIEAYP